MTRRKVIDLRGFLSFQILHELKRKRLCGDELAEIIGRKKSSKLTPGTIYPALKKLRHNKLVAFKQEGRKKLYTLAPNGEKEYIRAKKLFRKAFTDLLKS
ncbi:MAG: winged helix-turn-helix domain-containing protein [Nanoarchaeota archaeon]|nr:winged helix-turn-helix domain-containing protein [Nanoarchaeota archaeon]